jgi:hypothetical protein
LTCSSRFCPISSSYSIGAFLLKVVHRPVCVGVGNVVHTANRLRLHPLAVAQTPAQSAVDRVFPLLVAVEHMVQYQRQPGTRQIHIVVHKDQIPVVVVHIPRPGTAHCLGMIAPVPFQAGVVDVEDRQRRSDAAAHIAGIKPRAILLLVRILNQHAVVWTVPVYQSLTIRVTTQDPLLIGAVGQRKVMDNMLSRLGVSAPGLVVPGYCTGSPAVFNRMNVYLVIAADGIPVHHAEFGMHNLVPCIQLRQTIELDV